MKHVFIFLLFSMCLRLHGVSGVDTEEVSVMEGDSVTLNTGVEMNYQDRIRWYFNDILIAQISGYFSYICTDVQCNDDNERFRDRLKLDHQTGSLIIMNTRNTDSGEYTLVIFSSSSISEKIFKVSVHGVFGVDTEVSVMEGDSVTLNTDSGPSAAVASEIFIAVVVLLNIAGAAGLIYCCKRQARRKGIRRKRNDQANSAKDSSPGQNDTLLMETISDSSHNQNEPANDTPT